MKHKHYDVIIAYANGEQIQVRNGVNWTDIPSPSFLNEMKYRVKPKEVKLIPHWQAIVDNPLRLSHRLFKTKEEAVRWCRDTIRLATEYPAVLLSEKEEEEPISDSSR